MGDRIGSLKQVVALKDEIERLKAELAAAKERNECLLASIARMRTAAIIDDWETFDAVIAEAALDAKEPRK